MTVPVVYFCTISVLQIFLFGEMQGRRNRSRTGSLETRMLIKEIRLKFIAGLGCPLGIVTLDL